MIRNIDAVVLLSHILCSVITNLFSLLRSLENRHLIRHFGRWRDYHFLNFILEGSQGHSGACNLSCPRLWTKMPTVERSFRIWGSWTRHIIRQRAPERLSMTMCHLLDLVSEHSNVAALDMFCQLLMQFYRESREVNNDLAGENLAG